jgi:hypothetical protein
MRMLSSIDHDVEQVIVIDNGDCFEGQWRVTTHLRLPHNLGVSASWNLGIKASPRAPWWLIVNSDIEFAPGDLAQVAAAASSEPGIWHATEAADFAAFAISHSAIEVIGLFDENFVPAYYEDNDYARRAHLAGVPRHFLSAGLRHAGSAVIGSDKHYRRENDRTFPANRERYLAKWGGLPGEERFTTPFNAGGDIADWTLDVRRLRHLTWRRPGER